MDKFFLLTLARKFLPYFLSAKVGSELWKPFLLPLYPQSQPLCPPRGHSKSAKQTGSEGGGGKEGEGIAHRQSMPEER